MAFKIMVVEDEVDFREVLVDFLRLKGYEAT
jgi:CheY-like chemotaxis protein